MISEVGKIYLCFGIMYPFLAMYKIEPNTFVFWFGMFICSTLFGLHKIEILKEKLLEDLEDYES